MRQFHIFFGNHQIFDMFNVKITKSQQQELIFYYTNLNFLYVGFLVGSTILLCYGLSIVRLQVATAILLFILHHVYSLGITAGRPAP